DESLSRETLADLFVCCVLLAARRAVDIEQRAGRKALATILQRHRRVGKRDLATGGAAEEAAELFGGTLRAIADDRDADRFALDIEDDRILQAAAWMLRFIEADDEHARARAPSARADRRNVKESRTRIARGHMEIAHRLGESRRHG